MEQFNQKKSKAAAQEAARLAQELGAKELEVEKLDDEAERLLGKYVMEEEVRRRLECHMGLGMMKDELEVRETWPHGRPPVQVI
jgi:hypothetical protein